MNDATSVRTARKLAIGGLLLALALALPSRPAEANPVPLANAATKVARGVIKLLEFPDLPMPRQSRPPRVPEFIEPPLPPAWKNLPTELRPAVEKFWIEHRAPGAALPAPGQRAHFRVVSEGERRSRAELKEIRDQLRELLDELQGHAELDPEEDRHRLIAADVEQAVLIVSDLRTAWRIGFRNLKPAFAIAVAIDMLDASGLAEIAARELHCGTERQLCDFVAFAADVFDLMVRDMPPDRMSRS